MQVRVKSDYLIYICYTLFAIQLDCGSKTGAAPKLQRKSMEKSEQFITETYEIRPTRKKRILVIDDNVDLLRLNRLILEQEAYDVVTACSGFRALDLLGKIDPPDLILLDMRMEDMSGLEFLLTLEQKHQEIVKTVPVVFLTAVDHVPESKAVGFIKRPIALDKFLDRIYQFIKNGKEAHGTE